MDNRYKPLHVQQERSALRQIQHRLFQRNQAIGLLLVAAAILVYRLFHTHSGWLFPTGWWRL
jgi:hypothetical protein